MKESVSTFEQRCYFNFVKGKVFVWTSLKAKQDRMAKRPEIWDMETAKRYIAYLKGELG